MIYPELEFRKMVVHSIGHSTVRKTAREIFNNKNWGKAVSLTTSICENLDPFLSAFYHFFLIFP